MKLKVFGAEITLSKPRTETSHDVARRCLDGLAKRSGLSNETRKRATARQEAKLEAPAERLYPNFVWVNHSRFTFGISLKGLHWNVPAIAARWGYPEPACGNAHVYHGWLGSHFDL